MKMICTGLGCASSMQALKKKKSDPYEENPVVHGGSHVLRACAELAHPRSIFSITLNII